MRFEHIFADFNGYCAYFWLKSGILGNMRKLLCAWLNVSTFAADFTTQTKFLTL